MSQLLTRFNFPPTRQVDLTPQGKYPVAEYTGPAATFDEVLARQAAARQQAARSYRQPVAPMPQAAAMTPQEQMAASVRAKGMMPIVPTPKTDEAPPMGLAEAFRQPLTSPMGRGITAAALTGLDAGGFTDRPTTIGQGLARMGAAGIEAFDAAKAAEAAQAAEQQKLALEYAKTQAALATAGAKSQRELFKDETSLRKEYDKNSNKFVEAKIGFQKVQEAAMGEPSAASDLSLIFGYMKILDPTSVVRESEQASASNAAGVPDRIRNIWNRALTGERLTPSQRADFIATGRRLFQPYVLDQEARELQYEALSDVYGFSSENVVSKKSPKRGTLISPASFETEAEALSSGFEGYAYINGRLAKVEAD